MYYSKNKRFFFPLAFLAAIAGFSLLVMLIWNAIVPDLFLLPEIGYVQAVLLLILARLLFGGSPFRGHRYPSHMMHDKIRQMSPEEREEFRKKWSGTRRAPWHHHRTRTSEGPDSKSGQETV
jgi:hypothetical protein